MTRQGQRVAILGGGMAGIAAAWRLSEPGWRDRFASITVYQRGWRLGGKGASSRGVHGRIEEHGLHIWLGYYENAFRLLRECYAELDRPTTDPCAPIKTWRDAMIPAPVVGLEERHAGSWRHWVADFAPNAELPGEPDAPGGVLPVAELVRRSLRRLQDFAASLVAPPPVPATATGATAAGRVTLSTSPLPPPPSADAGSGAGAGAGGWTGFAAARIAVLATALEAATLAHGVLGRHRALAAIDGPLDAVRRVLLDAAEADDGVRRAWHLVSVITATVRGIVADGLLTDPRGFRKINDEDYRAWIGRHGAAPEALESTLVRGLYDLVFAQEDADPERASFGAGWGVFLSNKTFFDYKGEIFWKMTAGMGDIVFAPVYEALRRRGVDFAFFHRIDGLHLSPDRTAVDAVTVGVQAHLAPGAERYDPLVRVRGLPCFPATPLVEQLDGADGIEDHPLESHWCTWPDASQRVLRRGEDFDVAVLAIPLGMAPFVCSELIADRRDWQAMVANVRTVATQAFQLWLRADEPTLGWNRPGATMTGYVKPFDTWASMPQVLDAEDWPDHDRPGACAYFCTTLDAPEPADDPAPQRHRERVRANAVRFLERDLPHLLAGVATREGGFRWDLLCDGDGPGGSDRGGGSDGPGAFARQFWTANVDPSDRYVQSLAGTDQFRLRPDESGYDNLYLAGDWTDCGLNAGCIEAAVLSGLQAANAALGRSRRHRIAGYYLL